MIACGFTSSGTSKFSDLRAIQVNGGIARPSSDTRLARRGGLHGRTCTQTLILLIIKKTTRTVPSYDTRTYEEEGTQRVRSTRTCTTRYCTCTEELRTVHVHVVLSYSIYFRKYKLYNFMYTCTTLYVYTYTCSDCIKRVFIGSTFVLSYESTFVRKYFEYLRRYVYFRKYKSYHNTYSYKSNSISTLHVHYTCTCTTLLYFRSTKVPSEVLSYLSSIVYLSSYFRKYESTKVLSKVRKYESTFVRKYEDRYFRTFESTSGSTSGSTRTRTRTCTVLPEVRVHLQPPVRHSPSTFNILSFDRERSVLRVASSPRPPGDAFAAHESRRAGRVRTPGVGAAARAGARSRARDGARARAQTGLIANRGISPYNTKITPYQLPKVKNSQFFARNSVPERDYNCCPSCSTRSHSRTRVLSNLDAESASRVFFRR